MRKIAFSPPDITQLEIDEVVDTLKSGWITTGPKTKLFEKRIAEYCGTEKAVCLNSATACMELILRLYGVGEGDEVITSAYTYTASASVIAHVGAKIVLVDTQEDSFEMDYKRIPELITEKTKVIIPVDLAGVVCDYGKLYEVVEQCRDRFVANSEMQKQLGRVMILADGAHSFGAIQNGKRSGSIADFTSFSFHAVKNLTTGEGGALTWRNDRGWDNEAIYKQFMLMSLHGQNKDALAKTQLGSWEYDIVQPLYKCNMTDIMASIGLGQLSRYEELLKRRHEIIEKYNQCISKYNIQALHHKTENSASSGHLYLMRLLGRDSEWRNRFIEEMAEKGIACNVHYKPLPLLTAYKAFGLDMNQYPNAYKMYENEVTLPLHTLLTDEDVSYIYKSVEEVLS